MSYQDRGAVQGHTGGIFWFGAIAYVLSKILDSIRVLYAGLRKEVVKRVCIIAEFNTHDNIHQAEGINWAIHDCFSPHDVWSGDKRRSWGLQLADVIHCRGILLSRRTRCARRASRHEKKLSKVCCSLRETLTSGDVDFNSGFFYKVCLEQDPTHRLLAISSCKHTLGCH